MTTGELLVARAAMKPLATLNRPVLKTVDIETKEETVSFKERTDVTAVPAMGVVAETMVALVLADEALRKFGGDSLAEFVPQRRRATAVALREARWLTSRRPGHLVLVGLMGVGQDDGRPRAWRASLGRAFVDTDDRWSRRAPGGAVAGLFAAEGEAGVPRRSRPRCSPTPLEPTRAARRSPPAAAWCSREANRRALRERPTPSCGCAPTPASWPTGCRRRRRTAPLLADDPAGTLDAPRRRARGLYREVADADRRRRADDARRGRSHASASPTLVVDALGPELAEDAR